MRLDLYAIYNIWLREMLRFVRLRSRLIVSIGAPFFFLASLGMGFNIGGAGMSGFTKGVDYISFLTPGIIGMTLLFSATFTGLSVLWDREFGFLKDIMVASVSRCNNSGKDFWWSHYCNLPEHDHTDLRDGYGNEDSGPWGLYPFLRILGTDSCHLHRHWTAFASKMKDMSGFSMIMNFLIFPLFFLCGAIFPLERLPITVRTIANIDPLTYGVDGLRYCFLGASTMSPVLDLMVLTASCLAMLGLGAYLFESSDVD